MSVALGFDVVGKVDLVENCLVILQALYTRHLSEKEN